MDLSAAASIATIVGTVVVVGGLVWGGMKLVANRVSSRNAPIRVALSWGIITQVPAEPMLLLKAANHGERLVTLNTLGFLLPNKHTLFFPMPQGNVTMPH